MAWRLANEDAAPLPARKLADGALSGIPQDLSDLPDATSPAMEAARRAIMENIQDSCGVALGEALTRQARHSAEFMLSEPCRRGVIGTDYVKTTQI